MLTPEQLVTLRLIPLGDRPNRLAFALALTNTAQADVCRSLSIHAANLSNLVTGRTVNPTLDTARSLAEFFGCAIEDLFPARERGADDEAVAS